MKELISVIVPMYNSEKYIEHCIESIEKQTYTNIEILIIDDGSKDNSAQIAEQIAQKYKNIKVIHKKNGGVSSARNLGIEMSNGKYITFVDSDDWIEKEAIEGLYNDLKNNNADIVRGNYYIEYKNRGCIKSKEQPLKNITIEKNSNERNVLELDIINGKVLAYVWLLLIKKEVIVDNKIEFKENIGYMEDTIFYIELLNTDSTIFISDRIIYHYYENLESITKSQNNIEKKINNIIIVNKTITDILKIKNNDLKKSLLDTNNCNMIINLIFVLYFSIGYEVSFKTLLKVLENDYFSKMLDNCDKKYMSMHFRIESKLIKRKNIKLLYKYFKIRLFFRNLKKISLKM